MNNEFSVISLSINDYDEIVSLWNKSGLSTRPNGRDSKEEVEKQLKQDVVNFFGIRDDDKLIAVVLATDDTRKGWINRIAVDPDYRGKDLAKMIIEHCEKYFKNKGINVFAACIEDYNKASMSLFEAVGYIKHTDIFYYTKRTRNDV